MNMNIYNCPAANKFQEEQLDSKRLQLRTSQKVYVKQESEAVAFRFDMLHVLNHVPPAKTVPLQSLHWSVLNWQYLTSLFDFGFLVVKHAQCISVLGRSWPCWVRALHSQIPFPWSAPPWRNLQSSPQASKCGTLKSQMHKPRSYTMSSSTATFSYLFNALRVGALLVYKCS